MKQVFENKEPFIEEYTIQYYINKYTKMIWLEVKSESLKDYYLLDKEKNNKYYHIKISRIITFLAAFRNFCFFSNGSRPANVSDIEFDQILKLRQQIIENTENIAKILFDILKVGDKDIATSITLSEDQYIKLQSILNSDNILYSLNGKDLTLKPGIKEHILGHMSID